MGQRSRGRDGSQHRNQEDRRAYQRRQAIVSAPAVLAFCSRPTSSPSVKSDHLSPIGDDRRDLSWPVSFALLAPVG